MLRAVINGYALDMSKACLLYRAKMESGWARTRKYHYQGISEGTARTDEDSAFESLITTDGDYMSETESEEHTAKFSLSLLWNYTYRWTMESLVNQQMRPVLNY